MLLRENKAPDGGLNTGELKASDVCINAMALTYCCHFGAEESALHSLVDFVLGQRVSDGGFNCRSNRGRVAHSSVHTTASVIEGFTGYLGGGYGYRSEEVAGARGGAVEFLLRHRLYRSHRSGEPIRPEFTRLHHPARWHFDVLRGPEVLADAGVPHDPRMDDALEVIMRRRRADGRWAAASAYPGLTHVPQPRAGRPSRWVTLRALRVLDAYTSSFFS